MNVSTFFYTYILLVDDIPKTHKSPMKAINTDTLHTDGLSSSTYTNRDATQIS